MKLWRGRPPVIAAAALFALAALPRLALADGEAGVVLQDGDQVRTFCVAFTGDSVSGDELLKAAGLSVGQFGGSGGSAVCSIGQVGCFKPGSFNDCFCQCQGGSCTYWAFFTQKYGDSWKYSAVAFNSTRARDGDLHGWKWGKGSSQSAPVPAATTFEAVCGHAPRGGGAPATASPVAPAAPASGTNAPASQAPASATAPVASETVASITPRPAAADSSSTAVQVTLGAVTADASPPAPAAGTSTDHPGSSPAGGLAGFAAVVVVLGGGIAGAMVWRRRRGA